ncbi:bifunctional lysylphosphatidylglycerol flippase/synthetase MprF [Melissococcus plutonius]|uniref:L-O-lysylphosphatidylglycerol synthase n=1 Tax=Melissococcus plutonius TaxID=33970 RepID=A0A2Z5Y297_9ENTE|nr:bifunctional lysylphosphatidylglycerol flippase/synthetase MprF [Melissococcus plutonius]BAL62042.1 hypothetical protein MPD5_0800 [Melissococcus plutonius DAT561]MCV2499166.1 bifunctional lysylphosphatidylglycerol flippase/synthetase MprF [Melissococcus plutonius]MCV2500352.1 bifunctional lysylphosphatidylglycerol flippase/synthetase MprF [Melissococcus plutonius]MCV2505145.1 bifunctional lysylphosphatidylglycerol flippase/synthetase MprF [Melissococcus plutonius]MCV2507671.1 bifunctional 
MKKFIEWIKAHSNYFKIFFVISVLIIVIAELFSLGKTISFPQLVIIFSDIPIWKIFVMFLIGLISVFPMIGYDVILNRLLRQKPKWFYLIETSWIINTINNIAGFGGLISIGLRSEFYGKETDGKQVVKSLSKILIFLMAGLSIYSLLACFLVLAGNTTDYIDQFLPWLIVGGLYFPVVLIATMIKRNEYIGNIARKTKIELIFISFLEWSGVVFSFFAIGWLMNIPFHVFQILPLFIAASVIGIISMIPGELGSFDVMMIIGLTTIDIPRETVVAWILLYRLFYYIIPFLIGAFLFVKNLGVTISKRYSGVPYDLATEVAHKIVVFLMYFSGIMVVLSATIPEAFDRLKWLSRLNPLQFHIIIQFPAILLGFLLLITGRGISARVKRAYWPTIALIILTLVYTFFEDFNLGIIFFLAILLIIIIFSKKELFREQLVYSWEMITIDSIIFSVLILLYIAIGVYNLPSFSHRHHHRFASFFLIPSEQIWFSGFLAILFVFIYIYLFIRYLQGNKQKIGIAFDEDIALSILTTYGGNSDSQLVFLKDKDMFIYKNAENEATVLLQFRIYNNKCIVMGNPSGKKSDFSNALVAFMDETDRLGYLPVFYEVSEEIVIFLHEYGYDFIKMGEKAFVDLPSFTLSGKKRKSERVVMNRFNKENYHFEVLQPPFSAEFMQTLKNISDEWLDGRKEKGFSLGFFSVDYLQRGPIAVVKNKQDELIAFSNIMPTYNSAEGTIDLMRYRKNAPSGVMDFLFISLFEYMKEMGFHYFDLGMAPLANVGTSRKSFIQERIAYLVYEFGSHFYSFRGLRDYKGKFATDWSARYTLYSRNSFIVYVMIALLVSDNASVEKQKQPSLHGIRRILKNRYNR